MNSSIGGPFFCPFIRKYNQFLLANRLHYLFSVGLLGVSLFRGSDSSFTKIKLIAFIGRNAHKKN